MRIYHAMYRLHFYFWIIYFITIGKKVNVAIKVNTTTNIERGFMQFDIFYLFNYIYSFLLYSIFD